MDTNTNNNQMGNGMNYQSMPPKKEKRVGPIVGILIVVLALIIAIIYFVGAKIGTSTESMQNTQTNSQDNSSLTANASKADDVNTLNADLDSQLKDIDYSF